MTQTAADIAVRNQRIFAALDADAGKAVAEALPGFMLAMNRVGQNAPGSAPDGSPMTWEQVCEVALHKARVAAPYARKSHKAASRAWLIERGYRPTLPTFGEAMRRIGGGHHNDSH